MQKPYVPLTPGFVNVEYNNIEAIKNATTDKTCAVMIEPIQGEGGVNIPSVEYLKQLRHFCDEKGLMLIYDEVQTGMGRLGKLFGYQVFGVEPDVITLAKGIASGLPIGAILAKEKSAVFAPGDHGSTFGGNPLSTAAGYAVTRYIIEKDIPGNAARMGKYLMTRLNEMKAKHSSINDVRGIGLLIAIEFKEDIAGDVMKACLERGFMINLIKPNTLRVIPPLIIKRVEVEEGLGVLEEVLTEMGK